MRKREREHPCGVCRHNHKYDEGEVCGICGHRAPVSSEKTSLQVSAFPSVIWPNFLYLGSYDNASRSELLKTQGISHTVPACQNLYKNSFTYHCLQDDKILQFDDAVQFLEQCERDKAQVLVHCMSGKNRSPAIVIAYLMKSKGWRLPQSYQWVKEQRSSVKSRNMSERSLDHLIAAILLCLPSHLRSPHPSTLASQSQMIQFLFLFLFLLSTILVLLLFLPVHL